MTDSDLSTLRQTFREAWHHVADVLPPDDVWVEARRHLEDRVVLWQAKLMRHGALWFTEDGGVWDEEPTHWREVRNERVRAR